MLAKEKALFYIQLYLYREESNLRYRLISS
jgi:hypothetical protein